jgi:hypothetical protein
MSSRSLLAVLLVLAAGCGGGAPAFRESAPAPRRTVVWLDDGELDAATAERLRGVGVDEIVVRRGTFDLSGRAPILRIGEAPAVAGPIPVGYAFEVTGVRDGLDRAAAGELWRALERELGGLTPAELVLDLPQLGDGLPEFLVALREVSGVAVVPLLSVRQLQEAQGRAVAEALGSCVVPSFGTDGVGLRGIGELDPLPLGKKLEPLADTRVRVRVAVALSPRAEPPLGGPGDDLDPLTESAATTVSTSSALDRSFVFQRPLLWSGRRWTQGESLAIRWMDASKLRAALHEGHRLVMPELGGWDLVGLPAAGQRLGLGREEMIRFLGGEGPEPDLAVEVRRSGRSLRVRLANRSVFASAVSNHGNWLQVSVDEGWVTADGPGSFERLTRGTLRGDRFEQGSLERVNAVRFFEIYLAPGEEVSSGNVQVPSSRTEVTVRWHFTLLDGREVIGETTG